jgi:hypothetical protein
MQKSEELRWYDTLEGISGKISQENGLKEIIFARRAAAQTDEKLHVFFLFSGTFHLLEKGGTERLSSGTMSSKKFLVRMISNEVKELNSYDKRFSLVPHCPWDKFVESLNAVSPTLCAGEKDFVLKFPSLNEIEKEIGILFLELKSEMIPSMEELLTFNE